MRSNQTPRRNVEYAENTREWQKHATVFFQADSNLALTYWFPHLRVYPRPLRFFLCDLCVSLLRTWLNDYQNTRSNAEYAEYAENTGDRDRQPGSSQDGPPHVPARPLGHSQMTNSPWFVSGFRTGRPRRPVHRSFRYLPWEPRGRTAACEKRAGIPWREKIIRDLRWFSPNTHK